MLRPLNHGRTSQKALVDWFNSPLGSYLLEQEKACLSLEVRRFHGETLLWLGPVAPQRLELDLSRCMVRYHIFGSLGTEIETSGPAYLGNSENLPLATSSVEGVVCHHGLECAQDSRVALRELARILEPGGRLLVTVFNPYSFWGLRHIYSKFNQDAFSDLHFISHFRLSDWLGVLGFEVDPGITYVAFRPPVDVFSSDRIEEWQNLRSLCTRWGIPLGGVYVLSARKRNLGYVEPLSRMALSRKPRLDPVALSRRCVHSGVEALLRNKSTEELR